LEHYDRKFALQLAASAAKVKAKPFHEREHANCNEGRGWPHPRPGGAWAIQTILWGGQFEQVWVVGIVFEGLLGTFIPEPGENFANFAVPVPLAKLLTPELQHALKPLDTFLQNFIEFQEFAAQAEIPMTSHQWVGTLVRTFYSLAPNGHVNMSELENLNFYFSSGPFACRIGCDPGA
jgi:hypothetical protein